LTARSLEVVDARLRGSDWLECNRLTIADLACAPYLALAHQGGVNLDDYPGVREWTVRIASLHRFSAMDGWPTAKQENGSDRLDEEGRR
jgi:glutathione S-transferase